ncbi:hypothetical protein GGTG_13076 [Gaeumannomyces tritici R3-111a-1]|uniref:Uncharacterized protein n=1 Tax=Gaeumannomyces tritici (strain R3-111a-1) TaxID=644352 RepID=J3PHU5_GAET3|nr:hypothetical protein GGTG_13076 [Gaeumannomyces tritici R3-111a-1]EJT69457.1 hypothetical protein GGTG_13076 [Gaeumannomyces tritici R3-111a-1]
MHRREDSDTVMEDAYPRPPSITWGPTISWEAEVDLLCYAIEDLSIDDAPVKIPARLPTPEPTVVVARAVIPDVKVPVVQPGESDPTVASADEGILDWLGCENAFDRGRIDLGLGDPRFLKCGREYRKSVKGVVCAQPRERVAQPVVPSRPGRVMGGKSAVDPFVAFMLDGIDVDGKAAKKKNKQKPKNLTEALLYPYSLY